MFSFQKRYGCYRWAAKNIKTCWSITKKLFFRAGVLFSCILILILVVVICIPPIFSSLIDSQELNTYLLICLIIVLLIIGSAIVFFINYQHQNALKMRLKSENGLFTLQRARLRRGDREGDIVKDIAELQVRFLLNWESQNS